MVQKARIFSIKLLIFLLFCAIGLAIGSAAARYWEKLERAGAFVQWEFLDSPQKFRQFVYANHREIWAFAENGWFYMYRADFCYEVPGEVCHQWAELDPHGKFSDDMKNLVNSGCEAVYNYYSVEPRYPPQSNANPTECVVMQTNDPVFGTTTLTYYVLLDNGKVWMWRHKSNPEKMLAMFLSFILAGLVVGIITWLFFRKRITYFTGKIQE